MCAQSISSRGEGCQGDFRHPANHLTANPANRTVTPPENFKGDSAMNNVPAWKIWLLSAICAGLILSITDYLYERSPNSGIISAQGRNDVRPVTIERAP